jgi:hypothetical protein
MGLSLSTMIASVTFKTRPASVILPSRANVVDGMMNPEMIDDAIEIIMEGIRRKKRMNLIFNNRAGGNAPMIARLLAKKFISKEI